MTTIFIATTLKNTPLVVGDKIAFPTDVVGSHIATRYATVTEVSPKTIASDEYAIAQDEYGKRILIIDDMKFQKI
jgi:hypothetical protein